MTAWNVVVSVRDQGYKRAREILGIFGRVDETDYYNVLTLEVADPQAFLARLAELCAVAPDVLEAISRAIPAQKTFVFQTPEEFEEKARAAVLDWLPELAGKSFHVRLYRRGFKGRLKSPEEERFLDEALLAALAAGGTPGRIDFTRPDAVIDVETLGNRAGLSLWRREELERYPFLRVS
jgi:tRNA(Ser,Leu) C12 N-acetylase TAN1